MDTSHETPTSGTQWPHETVLGMRVSELLERHDQILPLLVRYGFTPLNNPALRRALAPTVTLAQALRLNPLPAEDRHELLEELIGLCLLADSAHFLREAHGLGKIRSRVEDEA